MHLPLPTTTTALLALLSSTSLALPNPQPQFSFPGGTGGSTRNDLSGVCKPITVIYARGTGESGNVGSVAGPPFFSALDSAFGAGNVAVQGVDYAATAAGFGGDPAGNSKMAGLVGTAVSKCPKTQIVVSGYSQGAMLVHNSASSYSAAGKAAIKAAVLFGDPYNGRAIPGISAGNVKTFCAAGDSVCAGTAIITPAHLSYGGNAGEAAAFVKGKIRL